MAGLAARWRERLSTAGAPRPPGASTLPTPPAANPARDPRLPVAGTELVRTYRDKLHRVVVHEADFEHDGQRYRSLSAIARKITGTAWNGHLFFGLGAAPGPARRGPRQRAA